MSRRGCIATGLWRLSTLLLLPSALSRSTLSFRTNRPRISVFHTQRDSTLLSWQLQQTELREASLRAMISAALAVRLHIHYSPTSSHACTYVHNTYMHAHAMNSAALAVRAVRLHPDMPTFPAK